MNKVEAFAGFAIYASFDGYAPDSEDLLLVADQEVAGLVADFLNKNPEDYGFLAAVEGYEWTKLFCVRPALRLTTEEFQTDFEQTCDQIRAMAEA